MARILTEDFDDSDGEWLKDELRPLGQTLKPFCVRCGGPVGSGARWMHTEDQFCHYIGPHCLGCQPAASDTPQ